LYHKKKCNQSQCFPNFASLLINPTNQSPRIAFSSFQKSCAEARSWTYESESSARGTIRIQEFADIRIAGRCVTDTINCYCAEAKRIQFRSQYEINSKTTGAQINYVQRVKISRLRLETQAMGIPTARHGKRDWKLWAFGGVQGIDGELGSSD
jgi:hypothetical protein